jgi:GntR family negative regulator for fad regulon and positive regulator of fabA
LIFPRQISDPVKSKQFFEKSQEVSVLRPRQASKAAATKCVNLNGDPFLIAAMRYLPLIGSGMMSSIFATLCNGNLTMVIKAQSPAGFAEEYIIESIWNNRFPPGTILPAERELSELIGVTRTTLREVLQRLARDGWLTIQHGKPTKVNNFWETSGLNILETLARLDHDRVPQLIDNLLSVRTNIATIFIRTAFRQHPEDALAVLATAREVEDHADAFAELDYSIFRGLAFASGNPIYGLILNGMKGLYTRIGRHYFANPEARSLALGFYHQLAKICEQGEHEQVYETVRRYGHESGLIWHKMQKTLPGDLAIHGR